MLLSAILGASTIPERPKLPPVISPVDDFNHLVDTPLSITVTATCDDGTTAPQWSISEEPAWLSLTANGLSAVLSGTPDTVAGPDNVIVSVMDNSGQSASIEFHVTVIAGAAPQISLVPVTEIPATVALEDYADWLYAGQSVVADRDSKAGATAIGALTQVGSGSLNRNAGVTSTIPTFAWAGGTPTETASALKAAIISPAETVAGRGFGLTVAALDGQAQTLRLFLNGIPYSAGPAKGRLSASLSDAPTDIKTLDVDFTATGFSPYVVDVTFLSTGINQTLTLTWVNLNSTGAIGFRAAALSAAAPPGTGLTVTPSSLSTEQYVPAMAAIEHTDADVALDVDVIPDHAYLADGGQGEGVFFSRVDTVISDNPIATMTFQALRQNVVVATAVVPLIQAGGVTEPPAIGYPEGATAWNLTAGVASSFVVTCARPVSVAGLPRGVQWIPASGGGGTLSWTPDPSAVKAYTIKLSAADALGRKRSQTLPVVVVA